MASNTYGMYQAVLPAVPLPTPTTGSIIIVAGNPNTLGTVGNPGQFAYDSVGNAWYYTANGTTWTAISGSGSGVMPQSGHGSPVGSVTPNAVGVLYLDLDTNNVWVATGATVNDWTLEVGA